jgi:hypothetical protein
MSDTTRLGGALVTFAHAIARQRWKPEATRQTLDSTPIVVLAHIPLWPVYADWGWGTDDGLQALTPPEAGNPPLRVVPPNSYMLSGKQMEEAMGMLIIRHKVKDYGKWRPMFDEHSLMQKAAGLSNPRVFRSANDKSEIVVVFDTKDTKRAKDFAASPDLRETMAKAGVMDRPNRPFP